MNFYEFYQLINENTVSQELKKFSQKPYHKEFIEKLNNFYKLYNLLNEYGENLIETLIKKFINEEPALTPEIIRRYIDRFERIKNNLPEKDITKYNWSDLESTVDNYQTKEKIKAGKLDPTVSDANLLLNKDGIRIYLGKDKKSCIRYSNGYTFCIGARGENNMYGYYRLSRKGTPYFIFNDNLPQTDKRHLIVLFVYKEENGGHSYSITLANNEKEHKYPTIESIVSDFHWINRLMPFLRDEKKGVVEPPALEYLEHYLKKCLDNLKNSIRLKYVRETEKSNWQVQSYIQTSLVELIQDANKPKLQEFLNGDANIAFIRIYPVLLEGQKPIKDVNDAKKNVEKVKSDRVEFWADSPIVPDHLDKVFIGLDNPRYFAFFAKNTSEILKNIKQKVNYFIEEFYLKKDSDEILTALDQKEQTFQRLFEINKEIKGNLNNGNYIKPLDQLTSFSQLFKNKGDSTIVPYLVIQVNDAKEEASNFIKHNTEEIDRLYDGKARYNKCLSYIKTLTAEQQQKIIDFCHADSIDNRPGSNRDLFDVLSYNGCFVFKIIEYVMKNKEVLNKNLNRLQISNIAQKVYYLNGNVDDILGLSNKLQ